MHPFSNDTYQSLINDTIGRIKSHVAGLSEPDIEKYHLDTSELITKFSLITPTLSEPVLDKEYEGLQYKSKITGDKRLLLVQPKPDCFPKKQTADLESIVVSGDELLFRPDPILESRENRTMSEILMEWFGTIKATLYQLDQNYVQVWNNDTLPNWVNSELNNRFTKITDDRIRKETINRLKNS